MAYMTKNKMIYASNKNTQGAGYGYGGFRDSVGIPTSFSVGMGWVWALKFNSHGSPAGRVLEEMAWVELRREGTLRVVQFLKFFLKKPRLKYSTIDHDKMAH